MEVRDTTSIFGRISSFYGLFYKYQNRYFGNLLDSMIKQLSLAEHQTVIDVGCGTGAFCAAWQERGFAVTGIDPEQKMIDIARSKTANPGIVLVKADVLKGLPFADNSFDIAIASYVAHGLRAEERQIMYKEMSRIAKHLVIIHDFNERRSLFLDLIETLEGGDYFGFIKAAREEISSAFPDAEFIEVGPRAMWYVGRSIL